MGRRGVAGIAGVFQVKERNNEPVGSLLMVINRRMGFIVLVYLLTLVASSFAVKGTDWVRCDESAREVSFGDGQRFRVSVYADGSGQFSEMCDGMSLLWEREAFEVEIVAVRRVLDMMSAGTPTLAVVDGDSLYVSSVLSDLSVRKQRVQSEQRCRRELEA